MKNNEAFEVLQIIFPRGYDLDARLVEAVQKHLKQSQQQLLERLEKGKDGIDERIAYYQSLNEKDLPSYARNINSGRLDALNEVKALIQEEKERL